MQYELRTRFTMDSGDPLEPGQVGRADRLLRQLYDYLPSHAAMGGARVGPHWFGNRYVVPDEVVFIVTTHYRTVFALTADRFRIEDALPALLAGPDWATGVSRSWAVGVDFEVLRAYTRAELEDPADPTKKLSHPC
jgi:hypothetical protein